MKKNYIKPEMTLYVMESRNNLLAGSGQNTMSFDYSDDVYNEEMKPLKNKYRRYLKLKKESPNRFISCWAEKQAKNDLRLW